jgi:hypothetical protein
MNKYEKDELIEYKPLKRVTETETEREREADRKS